MDIVIFVFFTSVCIFVLLAASNRGLAPCSELVGESCSQNLLFAILHSRLEHTPEPISFEGCFQAFGPGANVGSAAGSAFLEGGTQLTALATADANEESLIISTPAAYACAMGPTAVHLLPRIPLDWGFATPDWGLLGCLIAALLDTWIPDLRRLPIHARCL